MSVERVMPDGYVMRCSGLPNCQYCAEDLALALKSDIVDRIDELVNEQLERGWGEQR